MSFYNIYTIIIIIIMIMPVPVQMHIYNSCVDNVSLSLSIAACGADPVTRGLSITVNWLGIQVDVSAS